MSTTVAPPYVSGTPVALELVAAPLQPLVAPAAQLAARMRVAKAAVPAPTELLVPALVFLTCDPEAQVRAAAKESLLGMPADMLVPVLKGLLEPAVLDGAARAVYKADETVRAIVLNGHTADDTVRWLAGVGSASLCDTIGRNQVRALRHPAIVEAIYLNPRATQGVVQGLVELAVRGQLPLDHMPGFREMKALLLGEEEDASGPGLSDQEFASALLMATGQGEQVGDEEKVSASLTALILKMSVSQKVRLAMVGDAGARKLLIRDPKKMVALAVLKSPRLTDGEIATFAGTKSLADDIISAICRNRQWTKDYATRKALVFNPKTPLSYSMTFLRSLTKSDIKVAALSRDINQVVARTAKRMLAEQA